MNTKMNTEAEKIVMDLLEEGVEPLDEYIADAGWDYGHVKVWRLDDGRYAIEYGDSAASYYCITDDADDVDDLAAWLEWQDLDPDDDLVQTANVRGSEAIPQASEDDEGPFWILESRNFYGPISSHDLVRDDPWNPMEFSSYAEAKEWIDAQNSETYVLANNEASRPEYKIVKARFAFTSQYSPSGK